MNFQKVQKNYAQILVQLKESLIVWKKNILETLSKKNYHHKIRIYLISEKYLEDYEKYIINTLDINNLLKINNIFAETYNLYSQLFNSNFNNKTTLPKIFPLNEINYKFFKELAINKDNNNIQVINHFIGEFKELFFQITLANGFYLFYFVYNGNLRQGFLKINDINIMYEFEQNGPVFFAKNKTGKLLDDNEIFYFENNFQLYILRKTEINIEKTKKELEKINQRKLSNSSKLVNNQLIQSTFINLVNSKKLDKLTNIFNSNNKKKLLKKCTVGKENLQFEDENEDENQVKLSVIKIKSNYLTDGSVEDNSDDVYLTTSMFMDKSYIKRHSSIISDDDSPQGLIGLQNIGATCYMNATLQCFSNTHYLRDEFLKADFYSNLSNNQPKYKLSFALADVLRNLWLKYDDKKSYPPENFKKLISEMNPLFRGIQANDPKDLILFMLETMHSELKTINKDIIVNNNFIPNEHNLFEVYQDFANYYLSKNKSIIFDIFYGCTNIVTSCVICKSEIHNVQVNNILFFPLEEVRKYKNKDSNTPVNLIDCFEYNRRCDTYPSYYCNSCNNNNSTAISFTRYLYSPKVLIINLNRGKGIQYNVKINFEEYIDIRNFVYCIKSPYKYELMGVICHFGESSMSGHFIAFCKHFTLKGDKWYKFNDAFVEECTFNDVKTSGMPYVLFYSFLNVDES